MNTYKIYFVEVMGALGWALIGKTDKLSQARQWMRCQEEQGRWARMYFKTY